MLWIHMEEMEKIYLISTVLVIWQEIIGKVRGDTVVDIFLRFSNGFMIVFVKSRVVQIGINVPLRIRLTIMLRNCFSTFFWPFAERIFSSRQTCILISNWCMCKKIFLKHVQILLEVFYCHQESAIYQITECAGGKILLHWWFEEGLTSSGRSRAAWFCYRLPYILSWGRNWGIWMSSCHFLQE